MRNNSNNTDGLAKVLRLLRIANDLSISELAKKLDVSQSFVSQVEANKKRPSLQLLEKYSKALNVSQSTILFFDEENEKHNYGFQQSLLKILEVLTKQNSLKTE